MEAGERTGNCSRDGDMAIDCSRKTHTRRDMTHGCRVVQNVDCLHLRIRSLDFGKHFVSKGSARNQYGVDVARLYQVMDERWPEILRQEGREMVNAVRECREARVPFIGRWIARDNRRDSSRSCLN